jgi:hypothetical protein
MNVQMFLFQDGSLMICCICYFLWGENPCLIRCIPPVYLRSFLQNGEQKRHIFHIQQSYSCYTGLCISKVSLKVLSSSYMDLEVMSFERLHLRFLEISARPLSVKSVSIKGTVAPD